MDSVTNDKVQQRGSVAEDTYESYEQERKPQVDLVYPISNLHEFALCLAHCLARHAFRRSGRDVGPSCKDVDRQLATVLGPYTGCRCAVRVSQRPLDE